MRALVCKELSGIDGLAVEEIPMPEPAAGEVRIRVRAAGVNFADTLIVAGNYQVRPPLPFSPGFEVAGVVDAVGPGVADFKGGERVMAVADWGGFAQAVVVPQGQVFRLPDGVDDVVAAGFPVAYGTSHFGLRFKAALKPGESLLVLGAAGGVGLTAVETGKLLGARVIAAATGEAKMAIAREAGADETVDARAPDFRDTIKALTGGRGADVVYDPVGGQAFEQALRCTALGGRILIVGFASGEVPQIPANLLLVKNISVIGYYWGAHRTLAAEALAASFGELLGWLAQGQLKPHVSKTFPLAEAVAALKDLRARKTTGKVVLTVAD
ncbi:MAG TPA: NADPH:quinone oxidoreductase family protein [Defluviicoccus sp.]|nr:NADPH:quinone oxidoreductase family protein [Defluviicoccus sp.]